MALGRMRWVYGIGTHEAEYILYGIGSNSTHKV